MTLFATPRLNGWEGEYLVHCPECGFQLDALGRHAAIEAMSRLKNFHIHSDTK